MRLFLIITLSIGLFLFGTSVGATESALGASTLLPSKNKTNKIEEAGPLVTKEENKIFVLPVHPKTGVSGATGNLIVMFRPQIEMRSNRTAGNELFSLKGNDALPANTLLMKYGATIRQASDIDPRVLDKQRTLALRKTGKNSRRIDLAGMMCVEGIASNQLVAAATEFHSLQDVLWVEIEVKTKVAGDPVMINYCGTCGQTVGCTSAPCDFPHVFFGEGTTDTTVPPLNVGFCSDTTVCAQVITARPGCALIWDEVCASYALLIGPSQWSGSSDGYDTCLSTVQPVPELNFPDWSPIQASIVLQSSPFLAHLLVGAERAECCSAVCFIDPNCCTIEWDAICAQTAFGQTECYKTTNFLGDEPPLPSDGGNPFFPSPNATPLYDPKMLSAGVLMPLVAPVVLPGGGTAAIGSAPLALYTTFERQIPPTSVPVGPPVKPEFETFQRVTGFRAGGLDISRFISFLQLINSGNGLTVLNRMKVALIEPSALVNHEDLCPGGLGTPSKIIVEPNQTPIVDNAPKGDPNLYATDTEHGTASLGVLFAEDNMIGVTGIVPTVQPYFYPSVTFQNPGRLLTAMALATNEMNSPTTLDPNPGNVIVMPIVTFDDQPITTLLTTAALIASGIETGVTFVVAAGNYSQEVEDPIVGTEATIVVGGVFPGIPNKTALQSLNGVTVLGQETFYPGSSYSRCPLSNYSETPAAGGGNVTVSSWGEGVCTLGYGNLHCGANPPLATSNPEFNEYSTNRLRTYTATWGGTSPATAQIGGVVALLQAFAKTAFELPLTPQQMHDLLANYDNNQSVYPQSGLAAPTTFAEGFARFGDTLNPGVGTTGYVGGFPNLLQLARNIQTTGGGTIIDPESLDVQVVCGTPITAPTPLSLADIDQKYIKVKTARPGNGNSGLGPRVFYPSGNRILDIQVKKSLDVTSPEDIFRLGVSVTGRTISTNSAFVLAFIYNPVTNRWSFCPPYLQFLTGEDATLNYTLPCGYNASEFVFQDGGDLKAAVRIVMIPIGGLGQSTIWVDQIDVRYNDPLIDVTDCGGGGGGG